MEPNPIRLDASIAIYPDKADINLTESLAGACVFVGKYSARNVEPNSERAKQDAPFGIEFLSSVIREFQAANPESVTDEEDSISKDLAAPRTARYLRATVQFISAANARTSFPSRSARMYRSGLRITVQSLPQPQRHTKFKFGNFSGRHISVISSTGASLTALNANFNSVALRILNRIVVKSERPPTAGASSDNAYSSR